MKIEPVMIPVSSNPAVARKSWSWTTRAAPICAAPQRADTAEDYHHHDLPGGRPIDPLERGEAVADGEHASGQPGKRGGQDEGQELVTVD